MREMHPQKIIRNPIIIQRRSEKEILREYTLEARS